MLTITGAVTHCLLGLQLKCSFKTSRVSRGPSSNIYCSGSLQVWQIIIGKIRLEPLEGLSCNPLRKEKSNLCSGRIFMSHQNCPFSDWGARPSRGGWLHLLHPTCARSLEVTNASLRPRDAAARACKLQLRPAEERNRLVWDGQSLDSSAQKSKLRVFLPASLQCRNQTPKVDPRARLELHRGLSSQQ